MDGLSVRAAGASSLSRRDFVRQCCAVAALAAIGPGCARAEPAGPQSRRILINHLGFPEASPKSFVISGQPRGAAFRVVDTATRKLVREGTVQPYAGDFGSFAVGRFDDLTAPGSYELTIDGVAPARFTIGNDVYLPVVRASIEYFAKQRCGDSHTGYNAPCHMDDGRVGNAGGRRLDVSGGWHDACDLRKWVDATIYGMLGLSRVLDVLGPKRVDRASVIEEMRWGNRYFLSMQQPDGFVMNYCGGDSGNNFTDNIENTADDRTIDSEPCELPGQFLFCAAQAAMARHARDDDPEYSRRCLSAAERCMRWCTTSRNAGAAISLAAAVLACSELHQAEAPKPDPQWSRLAGEFARRLIALQEPSGREGGSGLGGAKAARGNVVDDGARLTGFFRTAADRREPLRDVHHGNLPLLALCELIERFGDHADAVRWRGSLDAHVAYLERVAKRSAFGIVPLGVYEGGDPGGNRLIGSCRYRWFMKRSGELRAGDDWWVGTNGHLSSNGVGLHRAAGITGSPELRKLAQQQADWVLGVNPFDASTITGFGRNQPKLYHPGAFRPPTPEIAGGVMNGLGGTDADEPALEPGSWNTCEYWTPVTAFTMWHLATLGA